MKFNHLAIAIVFTLPSVNGAAYAAEHTDAALLARLEALESRITTLEQRNSELTDQLAQSDSRVERVELRSAKASQPGPAPTYADVNDNFK